MIKELSTHAWSEWLSAFPEAHILQTASWGALKADFGWQPHFLAGETCGALVLLRKLPLGFNIAYIPKGPVGTNWSSILPALDDLCEQNRVVFLRIEPDAWEGTLPENRDDWVEFTPILADPIQPHRTIVISLEGNEDEWLMRMKQKTRYNIRLAQKSGLRVEESQDLGAFEKLMQVTGERDGFGVHSPAYYSRAYDLFLPPKQCVLLMAFYEEKPLAGVMIFKQGSRAWFLFGGSSNEERNRMPAYLVQWEAMRWASRSGCLEYDLWGAPDYDYDYLEANFQTRSDGLWGVYRFKRGFGGELKRSAGARDRVYNQSLYRVYQWYMKRKKSTM
ncbi:MAG: peptidoglycan bridge formation glycyltransferase FemA/FemB family protein [Chloroflexi bacterium]|nr:peptidoglycan bridge formation glycyltransferase FemA/FemB family protein [Chloroflexota bacterium]